MKSNINQELYQQAKLYVQRRSEREFKAEIKEVYDQLVFDSQIRKLTSAELKEVKKMYDLACKVKIRSMGGAHIIPALRNRLKTVLESGRCHLTELKELSDEVKQYWRYEQSCLKEK